MQPLPLFSLAGNVKPLAAGGSILGSVTLHLKLSSKAFMMLNPNLSVAIPASYCQQCLRQKTYRPIR
jgi:hypothetical protein